MRSARHSTTLLQPTTFAAPLGARPKISLHAPPGPEMGAARQRPVGPPQPRMLVKIDLHLLRENLSATWRHRPTEQEVLDFLASAGFVRSPDGWLGREEGLMRLDPSEVLSVEPIGRHN